MSSSSQDNQTRAKRAEYIAQRVAVVIIGALILSEVSKSISISLKTLNISATGSPTITPVVYLWFLLLLLVPLSSGMIRYIMRFGDMVGSIVIERAESTLEERLLKERERKKQEESGEGGSEDRSDKEPSTETND